MTKDRNKIRMKLRTKIILFGLLPTLVLMVAITVFSLWEMRRFLLELSEDEIIDELFKAATKLELQGAETERIVRTMALAQESGMFGRRVESTEFARKVLEEFPALIGAYFGYEPNADGNDRAPSVVGLKPESMDGTGRFLPYWKRPQENLAGFALEPLADMEISLYYRGQRNRFLGVDEMKDLVIINREGDEPIPMSEAVSSLASLQRSPKKGERSFLVTEPYFYQGRYLLEQTFPIIIDGEFKGIAGVDRALGDMETFIKDLRPFKSADFVLLSGRGRVVTASHDSDMKTRRLEDTAWGEILQKFYGNTGEVARPFKLDDPVTGVPSYFAAVTVPTGHWTLVMRVDESEIIQPISSTLWKVFIMTIIGVVAVILIIASLARVLLTRISTASEAARRVASGDLTVKVDSDVDDETGDLLRAIKGMVHDLSSLVGKVKTSSIQLVSTATQIGAASKQQEAVVNDFGASTNQIAAAAKEISATSSELVKTMEDVSLVASDTATMVDEGRSSLKEMSSSIEKLAQSTTSITNSLSVISEKANNIGSVITTITKVADQTNLLSLNAAIEAEKAGEYGVGFAVVAREIRRLADQTAVATLDIEQMVKEMQGSVSTGVMQMDKFNEEVRLRVSETETISHHLERIIERVQALTPRFDQVHEGMQSQSQGARQISDAMLQLTESARASAASLKEFNQAADQLHGAVRSLKEEVSRFKV
jgi:methyl-accepting chemotaxis protein WspA